VNYWKKKSCEGEGKGVMVALGPFKAVQWHGAVRGGWWHGAVRGGCACHVTEEEQGGQADTRRWDSGPVVADMVRSETREVGMPSGAPRSHTNGSGDIFHLNSKFHSGSNNSNSFQNSTNPKRTLLSFKKFK
jgi:hypothetical protein